MPCIYFIQPALKSMQSATWYLHIHVACIKDEVSICTNMRQIKIGYRTYIWSCTHTHTYGAYTHGYLTSKCKHNTNTSSGKTHSACCNGLTHMKSAITIRVQRKVEKFRKLGVKLQVGERKNSWKDRCWKHSQIEVSSDYIWVILAHKLPET